MAILQGIIPNQCPEGLPSAALKSGDKRGASHFDGGFASSESSAEDLDAVPVQPPRSVKKGGMPTKGTPPDRWSAANVDVVRQLQYQADFQRFKDYRYTKITTAQKACINTVDHSAYLKEARVAPNTVIAQCVFSVAAYRAALEAKGGDVARFDQEVKSFKKGPKGSQDPDSEKVPMEP